MQPSHSSGVEDGARQVAAASWRLVPETLQTLLIKGLRIALILVVARLLTRAVPALERFIVKRASARATSRAAAHGRASDSLLHESKHVETLVRVVGSIARAAVGGLAVVMVLAEIGLDIAPLLAGAGIAGVAIGFGAQSVVKDFFSGFFILLEGQFNVGDEVTINTVRGNVEEMTMRVTVLRDLAGSVHYFPNGGIGTVANHQAGWARATVPVTTPLNLAAADARHLLEAVAREASADEAVKLKAIGAVEVEGPIEATPQGLSWRIVARMKAGHVDEGRAAIVAALQRRLKVNDGGAFDWLASLKA
ncbi:MAG: mechanosensitive ion channel [Polyangiales bacterium]